MSGSEVTEKACRTCGEVKPLEEFAPQAKCLHGRRPYCKACERVRVRAWRETNLEKARQSARDYAERNREEAAARARAHYAANREAKLEYQKAYFKANPDVARRARVKRQLREEAAYVADVIFDDILVRDLGLCGICGEPIMETTIELDHIIPLSRNGTHEPDNVQIAHRSCNRRKYTKVA